MLHTLPVLFGAGRDFLVRTAGEPLVTRRGTPFSAGTNVTPAEQVCGKLFRRDLMPSAACSHIEGADISAGEQLQRRLDPVGLVELG